MDQHTTTEEADITFAKHPGSFRGRSLLACCDNFDQKPSYSVAAAHQQCAGETCGAAFAILAVVADRKAELLIMGYPSHTP